MNRLLITGSSGFVGVNIMPYLKAKEYDIKTISRRPNGPHNIQYEHLGLSDLNSATAIIHLAGKAHDLKKVSNDEEYYEVNTNLTNKLFDQFLKSKASVFIYISSVKAVADKVESILTEAVIPDPKTVYGKSKLLAETYLLSKKLPKDKKLYILRPCMIHGPGNKGNLNVLYTLVKNGIPYPFGSFENKRSFLSVENLCFIVHKLLEKRPSSGVYNLADDEAISTNALVGLISETLGKKPRIFKLSKGLVSAFAKAGTVLNAPINEEKLGKLTDNFIVSNSKITETLGVVLPVTTRNGLIQTITSFK